MRYINVQIRYNLHRWKKKQSVSASVIGWLSIFFICATDCENLTIGHSLLIVHVNYRWFVLKCYRLRISLKPVSKSQKTHAHLCVDCMSSCPQRTTYNQWIIQHQFFEILAWFSDRRQWNGLQNLYDSGSPCKCDFRFFSSNCKEHFNCFKTVHFSS